MKGEVKEGIKKREGWWMRLQEGGKKEDDD